MTNLALARSLAENIRFKGENKNKEDIFFNHDFIYEYKDDLFINGLEINKYLTPSIEILLEEVCNNLLLDRKNVFAFVHNSLEYQASCLIVDEDQCILKLSSNLIKDMENKELQFIIGHELGHFLLTHASDSNLSSNKTNRYKRAQEISVDRLGLISCGDINIAAQTVIKMISGLNKKYIRFDINKYLSQLTQVSNFDNTRAYMSTHPTMIIRLKALLWFSMKVNLTDYKNGFDNNLIFKIDENIQNDLNKYIEKPIIEEKNKLNLEMRLWIDLKGYLDNGKFTKINQKKFENKYGVSKLNKTINFLKNNDAKTINKHINKKIFYYQNRVESL